MGDSVKKLHKKAMGGLEESGKTALGRGKIVEKVEKKIEAPFRKGTSAARREAQKQIHKQNLMEQQKAAEAESEIATKRAMTKKGGRQSLIKSSGAGLAQNLGGTA